ncbi:alpha/beta fold hydrolase [Ningiella sp. W23]|uniref:alpha/beta fold hydrolase n=1 Tax=Ningiella sp. W23 TaxID=3023715 RepID=UPI0037578166
MYLLSRFVLLSLLILVSYFSMACKDAVVLVHGNGAYPSSWNNTYNLLRASGYEENEIVRPSWGSKTCVACNNHSGSEESPVRQAISNAIALSCTGKIDVVGHSMGVTLAIQQIAKLNASASVDSFVGIAGAVRGLRSCGWYPFNVPSSTCGRNGLSINSPFLRSISNVSIASRVYSIKSNFDQVVCAGGSCRTSGVHSSQILGETSSFTLALGHFGLQTDTAAIQLQLIL